MGYIYYEIDKQHTVCENPNKKTNRQAQIEKDNRI
jgi:hypothetical protein